MHAHSGRLLRADDVLVGLLYGRCIVCICDPGGTGMGAGSYSIMHVVGGLVGS
jgi:hypothetical protein